MMSNDSYESDPAQVRSALIAAGLLRPVNPGASAALLTPLRTTDDRPVLCIDAAGKTSAAADVHRQRSAPGKTFSFIDNHALAEAVAAISKQYRRRNEKRN